MLKDLYMNVGMTVSRQRYKRPINIYLNEYCKRNKIKQRDISKKFAESGINYSYNAIHYILTGRNACLPHFLLRFYLDFNIDSKLNLVKLFERADFIPEGLCDDCVKLIIKKLSEQSQLVHLKHQGYNKRSTRTFDDFLPKPEPEKEVIEYNTIYVD